jgi:hypothetical protein
MARPPLFVVHIYPLNPASSFSITLTLAVIFARSMRLRVSMRTPSPAGEFGLGQPEPETATWEPEDACSLRQEIKSFRRKTVRKVKIDTNL